jgi:hypothetical protein
MSSLSFVQIIVRECILSTEDAIGFIRPHGRIGEKLQRAALTEDGVKGIVDDRAAIERMACKGRVFKVRHLFLLAEPKARKRGGWRKDLLDFMGRVEDKGAIIKDVDLQLTTEKPSHRSAMVLQAIEQLSNNGRTVHLKGKRQGRKATAFDAAALKDAKAAWRNVKDYPTWGDVAKALPEGFTTARAYKLFGKRL